ncbi:hypothetical protein LEP1GSC050_2773 [Leptospira broomii serovar Hurstbridge str. 5399]|uniref:ISXO2-like transposase domain protein n=1 Tax=Leptospira broomii serovar Hurstbridge str. 5399 TaxID=1049789 RepID=T0GDR7_9LEPT|nr:hypothetical protein LEP1GSC050_2773 [Leptospira broomii serovar Hurstbridge str. 5399]
MRFPKIAFRAKKNWIRKSSRSIFVDNLENSQKGLKISSILRLFSLKSLQMAVTLSGYPFITFHKSQNASTHTFLRKVLGTDNLPTVSGENGLVVTSDSRRSSTVKQLKPSAKTRFNSKFPHINIFYHTELTKSLLRNLYPKDCPSCNVSLSKDVSTRENVIRCPKCKYQISRTSGTPLEHLKIPLWTFSYVLLEAIHRFPLGLSASEIQRRLGISSRTSTLLKRRLQVFLSDLIPSIKDEMVKDIKKAWRGKNLPENGDLRPFIEGKPVVSIDTLALFSASQRANGFRKRFKHKGQTASIYLSDAVAKQKGVYQIGTLALTQAIKGGPVIFDSIPDQKQRTVQPFLDYLPKNTVTFGDEGFPYLERNNVNYRQVNHSLRAVDSKRNVWGRNRWSTEAGVNNQCAEGNQRSIKYSFLASYSYFKPSNSILYLNEYSALKGIRVYGLEKLNSKNLKLLRNVSSRSRLKLKRCPTKALRKLAVHYWYLEIRPPIFF